MKSEKSEGNKERGRVETGSGGAGKSTKPSRAEGKAWRVT